MTTTASSSTLDLIHAYYASKPDIAELASREKTPKPPSDKLERLNLTENQRNNKYLRRRLGLGSSRMPVHPAEENATGSITDQVAKESKDSTASTHEHHQEGSGATSGGSLGAAAAHRAAPGPVSAENIGEPASKEELKKRAEELNK